MNKSFVARLPAVMVMVLILARASASSAVEEKADKSGNFTGTIESLDVKVRTLQVKSQSSHMTFEVAKDAKIETQAKKEASLKDLKVADEIRIEYAVVKGVNIAQKITPKEKESARGIEEDKEPLKY